MFAWETAYRIGEPVMDGQHVVLFSILNQLDININQEMTEGIGDVLGALEAYILYHFSQEEDLMKAWDFPDFDSHVETHKAFIAEVRRIRGMASDDPLRSALKARGFVLDWLLGHILHSDSEYARHIANRKGERVDGN